MPLDKILLYCHPRRLEYQPTIQQNQNFSHKSFHDHYHADTGCPMVLKQDVTRKYCCFTPHLDLIACAAMTLGP